MSPTVTPQSINPQRTINFKDLVNYEKRPDKQVKMGFPKRKAKTKTNQCSSVYTVNQSANYHYKKKKSHILPPPSKSNGDKVYHQNTTKTSAGKQVIHNAENNLALDQSKPRV